MDIVHSLYLALCDCIPSLGTGSSVVKLNTRSLKVVRLLGEGGFSYVYLVSDNAGELYALKKIRCPFGEESVKSATKEIEAYRLFNHPSIIKVIDHATIQESDGTKVVFILLPYYKRGNLQDMINLNSVKGTRITQTNLLKIFRGICVGLQQLHEHRFSDTMSSSQSFLGSDEATEPLMNEALQVSDDADDFVPYAHFDLKPANVMLNDDDDHTVLMDFGSCKKARQRVTTRSQALKIQDQAAEQSTMPYRAPELFDCATNSTIDEKVDIWSLGCILYALCYFHSPFETSQTESGSVALAVLNCQYKFENPSNYGPPIQNMIRKCLSLKAEDRPSVRALITETDQLLAAEME